MSTKQNTNSNQSSTNALQFNPGAEGIYNALTQGGGNVLQQYMNNPLNNPFYNLGRSQGQAGASAMGQQAMGVLGQNQKVSGLTGQAGAGWLGAQKAQTGRSNLSMMSQANLSNIMNAFNRQMGATGQAMSFSPQITGSSGTGTSNSTTTTSGTGTWLPQLLGAGLGMATGNMGSLGSLFGGGGSSPQAPQSIPSSGGSVFAGAPSGPSGVFGTVPGSSGFNPLQMAMFQ
jgi:hypothetical protein